MNTYYVAGVPYSSELYHYGILGQKWGVRRYQNKDGSLTSEGRKHYGVKSERGSFKDAAGKVGNTVKVSGKKAASAVGNAAKAATAYTKQRFKMNHPSLLSDQELKDYTQRLIAEKNYSQLASQVDSPSVAGHASRLVKNLLRDVGGLPVSAIRTVGSISGEMLKRGSMTLADAGFRKIAQEMTKSRLERENERLERLSKNQELQKKLSNKKDLDDINRELEKQVRNKELREKLSDESSFGALQKARSIMGNPNASASQISEANKILNNYSSAMDKLNIIFGESPAKTAPSSGSSESPTSSSSESSTSSIFKMKPLESMGELSKKPGSSTRMIDYDTSKRGDSSYLEPRNDVTKMRFIAPDNKAETEKKVLDWMGYFDYRNA